MTTTLSPDIWRALHEGRKSLTAPQQRQLLQVAEQFDDRSKALCLLVYYTGSRISEAIRLRRDHICNQRHFVVLHTLKQRSRPKLRAVPVPPFMIDLLLSLPVAEDGRLFPFSRWTAARRLSTIFEKAQIVGKQANSRSLRHSYQDRAVNLPTRATAALLGHTPQVNQRCYGDLIGYELTELVRQTWEVR